MEIKQSIEIKPKLTQQLVITTQLQLAIKLLQLSRLELQEQIRQELEDNPVLEEDVEGVDLETITDEKAPVEVRPKYRSVDWEKFLENSSLDTRSYVVSRGGEEESELPFEQIVSKKESFFEHLLWQIRLANFTPEEEKFAILVIGNLDEDGYLSKDVKLEELAEEAGLNIDDAEEVLKEIQEFDPVGVASRDLKECLLVQARVLGLPEIVKIIIEEYLERLQNKDYIYIARRLQVGVEDIVTAAKLITNLEPRPARNYKESEPIYIVPDVYVRKVGDQFYVELNDDGLPRLKISSYYRRAFYKDPKTAQFIKKKLNSAQWLIHALEQRKRTILRVAECIVEKQREFFELGPGHLKPMVLRDIALTLDLHESTISRVTSNKYIHTPHGIFPFKYFFNSKLKTTSYEDVSSEEVKTKIKLLIEGEDKKRPLSDREISEILRKEGIIVARRTVAKYRELLGILPSSKRKQIF